MTTIERLDEIYGKMETVPLSHILPLLLPLALDCGDYEGYCILTFWGNPLSKEKQTNAAFREEIIKILLGEGLKADRIKEIERSSFIHYVKLRTANENEMMIFSAKEMEDTIKSLDNMLEAIETPRGLAPVDLYFRSEAEKKEKLIIIEKRQKIEKGYAVLRSYITSKLTQYRRIAVLKERRETMENRIVNSKNIFIIHGHNEAKRRELSTLLKDKWSLNPIVLSEKPDQGLTIIEKFEKYAADCSYAFALFTPDDIVTNGTTQYFQARPNVIFELGWFYANLGRARVCILDQASEESRIFSDLQGVMRIQFINSVSEKYLEIERELKTVGII